MLITHVNTSKQGLLGSLHTKFKANQLRAFETLIMTKRDV